MAHLLSVVRRPEASSYPERARLATRLEGPWPVRSGSLPSLSTEPTNQGTTPGPPKRLVAVLAALSGLAILAAVILAWQPGRGPGPAPAATSTPRPTPPSPDPTSEPPPPPEPEPFGFRFEVRSVERVFTGGSPRPAVVRRAVRAAKREVRHVVTRMHRLALFQPENWQTGRYGSALAAFSGPARRSASKDLRVLTLGPRAGEVYESVRPTGGWLRITVLIGRQGGVSTAEVRTEFRARARRANGEVDVILSRGEYFLHEEGGWRIQAYAVKRHDRSAKGT